MTEYYRLCRLTGGRSFDPAESPVFVDLDSADVASPITSDVQLRASAAPNVYFWISGGGSVLIEDRFLVVVQRSSEARVHPGMLSLFTGRADNEVEWRNPELLLRELFEELIFVDAAGSVLVPMVRGAGVDPLPICREFCQRSGRSLATTTRIPLRAFELGATEVEIKADGITYRRNMLLHINEMGDINAIYLFTLGGTLDEFRAVDGEADQNRQRQIFALDVASMVAINVTFGSAREQRQVKESELTEHCRFLVNEVRSHRRP